MAVITTIRPTTELEAINVMLGSIGEDQLPAGTDLSDEQDDANVEMAISFLRESTREILSAGWRFNTLTGFEVAPIAQHPWEDTEGTTTTLNVFKVPADALSWKQTPCSQMLGLDLIERKSLQYTEGGAPVRVLFDRVRNRDGAEATRYPKLYLDVVFSSDFEDLPESARRYATVLAARRLAHRVAGSESQARFSQHDEVSALRILKREQGITEDLNLFSTKEANEIHGRRPRYGGGFSTRVFPGGS